MPDRFPTLSDVRRAVAGKPDRRLERRRYDSRRDQDPRLAFAAKVRGSGRWQAARAIVMARQPLCVSCLERGLTTQADDVDHVLGLAERPDLAFEVSNLAPLCRPCHVKKEAKVRSGGRVPKPTPAPAPGTATTPTALAAQRAAAGLRVLEGSLGKLKVEPGDVLVVMVPRPLSSTAVENVKAGMALAFPGHQVLVLDEGMTVGAVTPARTAPTST